jgi:Zn-dependent M16 (insulinase) family peptidase
MRSTVLVLSLFSIMTLSRSSNAMELGDLTAGRTLHGFRTDALYLNGSGQPMGARFVHQASGFTVDLLQIESVPQAFTWVGTTPISDQGEPHTQEHLLLGKGTTGRAFASLDTMWLSTSSAFTRQRETAYHFNTSAGPDVFFTLLERQLDALLHPNYTDEEIRREVCNFGVTQNADGTRRLEEKGSVYNEMVSSTTSSGRVAYRAIMQLVYGAGHPMALNSGGEPSGIRTMKPDDIRAFHRAHYFLANMGTIVALPHTLPLSDALTHIDAALTRVEPARASHPTPGQTLPPPQPAVPGTITYAEYPHKNDRQPSPLWFYWPANRQLDPDQFTLLQLFLYTVAGDPSTNLYKVFIDSRSRRLDTGARAVSADVDWDAGQPVAVYLQDVSPEHFNDARIAEIRKLVTDEIERVAAFADGSPELAEFNERVAANLVQTRRNAVKFVDSPPGFGLRGTGSSWFEHIQMLSDAPGFRKSVTLEPELAFAERQADPKKNHWREWLAKWHITGVTPYAVAARPVPALLEREETARAARGEAEAKRLAAQYGVSDGQAAVQRYQAEYDAATARIEDEARSVTPPKLVDSLPMSLDDALQFETRTVEGDVPFFASHFENMSSGTLGLALRLDGVPRARLRYVGLLASLLSRVGVIEDGRPVSYEEMTQRLRREILSLNASISSNPRTERVELVVRGAGLGPDEMRRALKWMGLVLQSPDWRPENLARIRDLVDQSLSGLRSTMQGSEESWVQNPQLAYWRQRNPVLLATSSFLTTTHDALRIKWLLKDAEPEDAKAVAALLDELAALGKNTPRAELKARLARAETLDKLSPKAREIAADALKDLDLALIDVPDDSLAVDWAYLCTALRDDLLTPAGDVLAALQDVRKALLKTGGARLFFVGSTALDKAIAPDVARLVAGFERGPAPTLASRDVPLVDARLRERDPRATRPVHLALFTSAKPGGVILTSVPSAHYSDAGDREKMLDYLAASLYSGSGSHGIFLKTIGAGLAYSNGVRASATTGRLAYYAERTPEVSQTVRFVIDELKKTPPESGLADYVVAQVFASRASGSYENRAEAMANDLVDGQSPDTVRKFREAVLTLRREPDFVRHLLERKDAVYARALPGYGVKTGDLGDGFDFVIGPEKQLASWQSYLEESEGKDTRVYRLYGRDFWMP